MSTQEILWQPPEDVLATTNIGRYLTWLGETRGLRFADYDALWRWSVDDLDGFWGSIADHAGVRFHHPPSAALLSETMPGTRWFPGATLNFAENVLAGQLDDIVLVARSESRPRITLTRGELRARVAALRATLLRLGVRRGDRIAAYLPNIPEAFVVLYAAASMGAVFTACAPESGARHAIGKFAQLEPTVLVAVDGYVYGGAPFDRRAEVAAIRSAIPTITTTIGVDYLAAGQTRIPDALAWDDAVAGGGELEFDEVPFGHPLYVVFSSGTTGPPKAIVHSHGGILLEHYKLFVLHEDLTPRDRWFWFSSTNWMAWNYGASTLLGGGSNLIFDGHPMRPSVLAYWKLLADEQVTSLGTSPGFLLACQKAGLVPRQEADISRLRAINVGGSPLTEELSRWIYQAVSADAYLASGSGGTDVASSFVSGCRLLPVRAGRIACRLLGVDAQAYDDGGRVVVDRRGELVIRKPMPSMPVQLWGDDGSRLFESYFARYPGVWCHGDWAIFSSDGTCRITGRSDATLNRGGVRLGTSEFYGAIDELSAIGDSLVVHLEDPDGGPGNLVLFVTTPDGGEVPEAAQQEIRDRLRHELSPRHVPDLIVQVAGIPKTLTGKKMEVPVKRAIIEPDYGQPGDGLDEFRAMAARLRITRAAGLGTPG